MKIDKIVVIIATSNKRVDKLINGSLYSVYNQSKINSTDVVVCIVDDNKKNKGFNEIHRTIQSKIDEMRIKCNLNRNEYVTYLLTNKRKAHFSGTGAWNTAISWASKKYSMSKTYHLYQCTKTVKQSKIRPIAVFGYLEYNFENGIKEVRRFSKKELTSKMFFIGNPGVQTSNLFILLNEIVSLNGFDEDFKSTTDREFMIRFLNKNNSDKKLSRILLTKKITVEYFMKTKGSVTTNMKMKKEGLNCFYRKFSKYFTEKDKGKSLARAKRLFNYKEVC